MSENDLYVRENFRRLPWWVTGRMLKERYVSGESWADDDVYLWAVPESISVRTLRSGRKRHAGKVRNMPFDLVGSGKIRKAVERWG